MEEVHKGKPTISSTCSTEEQGLVCSERRPSQGERCVPKGGARGRFFYTPHAVNRYRERVHRGISYERALFELIEIGEKAHYVKDYNSGQYWRGPKPMRLRMIVAPSIGAELPQVTTILPAADNLVSK